jgi:hypothetical protein
VKASCHGRFLAPFAFVSARMIIGSPSATSLSSGAPFLGRRYQDQSLLVRYTQGMSRGQPHRPAGMQAAASKPGGPDGPPAHGRARQAECERLSGGERFELCGRELLC